MKYTYRGVSTSAQFLRVFFTVEDVVALQFAEVKVPLEDLLQGAVTEGMDRIYRRKMIELWSEVDLADPLF